MLCAWGWSWGSASPPQLRPHQAGITAQPPPCCCCRFDVGRDETVTIHVALPVSSLHPPVLRPPVLRPPVFLSSILPSSCPPVLYPPVLRPPILPSSILPSSILLSSHPPILPFSVLPSSVLPSPSLCCQPQPSPQPHFTDAGAESQRSGIMPRASRPEQEASGQGSLSFCECESEP